MGCWIELSLEPLEHPQHRQAAAAAAASLRLAPNLATKEDTAAVEAAHDTVAVVVVVLAQMERIHLVTEVVAVVDVAVVVDDAVIGC